MSPAASRAVARCAAGFRHAAEGWRGLAATVALATLLRAWFALRVHPIGDFVFADMAVYEHRAGQFLGRALEAWDTFTPVGYPAFVAAMHRLAGARFFPAMALAQALMGGATALLTHAIALRASGSRTLALAAAAIVAVHVPLVLYAGLLLTETLCTLLVSAFVLATFEACRRERIGWALAAGVCLGAGAVVRPNLVFVVPFVAAWMLWRLRGRAPRALALGAAIGAGAAPIVAAVAVHLSRIAGRPVLFGTNGGINFFLAHTRMQGALYREGAFVHRVFPWRNLVRYLGRYDAPVPFHDEAHWYREGLLHIRSHPLSLLEAFGNVWDGTGLGVLGYWPGWEGHDGWLDLASTAFAVLVVLPALVVMALDLRRGAADDDGLAMRRLAGALVAGAFLGMYVFIGDPRLRVPFDPLLVVLALVALRRALPSLARARARWEARRAARA